MADEQKKLKTGKEASVKGVIAALSGMEVGLRQEHERLEMVKLKLLEIIQHIVEAGAVWFGFDHNNVLGTEHCWICGDGFNTDLVVGLIGFKDYEKDDGYGACAMICQRCLSSFDSEMGESLAIARKLKEMVVEAELASGKDS